MSFKAFICESSGEFVSPESCWTCAHRGAQPSCHLTAPVIHGILSNMRPDQPEALFAAGFGTLTVTTILGCPRKWRLKIEYDYAEKPSRLWWAFRGQIAHNIVEQYAKNDAQILVEQRLSFMVQLTRLPPRINDHIVMNGEYVVLTGQPDLVYLDRGHLMDFKSTKKVPQTWKIYTCPKSGEVLWEGQWRRRRDYVFRCDCGDVHKPRDVETEGAPRPYPNHQRQVSIYSYMLAQNGVEIRSAEIVYLDMERTLRLPIELIPSEEIEGELAERLPAFLSEEFPTPLEPINGKAPWECDFCPVRDHCNSLAEGKPLPQVATSEKVPAAAVETRLLAELGYGD
jgi:hypothetical protein